MPGTTQPAIQLYTVRRLLAADPDGTLDALAGFGYREVEAFDLATWGPVLGPGLARAGLAARSTHGGLLDAPDVTLRDAADLGIPLVIHPWTDPGRWERAEDVEVIARGLNEAARRAADLGIRVGYHNHHFELASRIDGAHALEVLAARLDPAVSLEVDAYWAFAGGADVPALVRRLGERVVALHLKDGDGSLDTSRQVACGRGVVPLREAVEAAPGALRIVELDDTSGDLLEAVRDSRDFVASLA